MDWAVLLMAYGGPDSLEDVEPYLLDVRGGRETPQSLVEEIRERYAQIGGRSPLLPLTRAQGFALEMTLNEQNGSGRCRVFVGMRHWKPYIREAVQEIHEAGFERVVALCMTPFASRMSTGAYREKLNSALKEVAPDGNIQARVIDYWYDNPRYIQSMKSLVQAGLEKFPADVQEHVPVLFTAHSLPAAIMQQGDPYAEQFAHAAALTARAVGLPEDRWKVGYQSAGASNGRWLGPSLEDMLDELASNGAAHALVAPIGFVSDHVEILYDIDIEAKGYAEQLGIHLERINAPNVSTAFIEALADIVLSEIQDEPSIEPSA